jgi:ADP-ribose pyrophosphatase
VSTRIIIADGLTNEFLSPEVQFRVRKVNIGTHEIDRLMGSGSEYGGGPLPAFLSQIPVSEGDRTQRALLLLRDLDEGDSADGMGTGSADFVEPIQPLLPSADIIAAKRGEVPVTSFCQAIARVSGVDPLAGSTARGSVRFLLVGCHSDKRILSLAMFLHNVLGFKDVAICSHLVGSPIREAHLASLLHSYPSCGVRVFLDLAQTARYIGFDPAAFSEFSCKPCRIMPMEARRALGSERKKIIEFLCMHWTRADLTPLQGGYTGSLLFLANGWKGRSRAEPMVLKVDNYAQMRREIEGYQEVKDLLGKNVPTFTLPVTFGDSTGVGMELAAMEGRPETLQDSFESAEGEDSTSQFMRRLDKALDLVAEKLYRNTRVSSWVVPYRRFDLHTQQQLDWLRENAGHIMEYVKRAKIKETPLPAESLEKMLRLIASNEDGLESEICLAHGDLNLKNVICDEGDNIWFIDWTHSNHHPVEMDFAKIENDLKFVMSTQFENDDLPRLRKFEEYLLSNRDPAEANRLPKSLKFVKWDLRFRKILDAVRRIRQVCFSLKDDKSDWVIYRIALLKYALHTLSFDEQRGQGECGTTQLLHALFSIEGLAFILVADDFNLKIRGEKPSSYPRRLRVLIDEALWAVPCPDYQPPYHVDPSVLEMAADLDDADRPLNPRGRTGIAGRGLLGRWGANPMVAVVVTRINRETLAPEVLLGKLEESGALSLPRSFVAKNETAEAAIVQMLEQCIGRPPDRQGEVIAEGYSYDERQTDHAWVELEAQLYHMDADAQPSALQSSGAGIQDIEWWPLEPATINGLPSNQAGLVREATRRLMDWDVIARDSAVQLLAKTG